MPNSVRTGTRGMGFGNRWANGRCLAAARPDYSIPDLEPAWGMRRGYCRGGGRGWRNMFYATGLPGWLRAGRNFMLGQNTDPGIPKQVLQNRAEILQSELDLLKKRLAEIDQRTASASVDS